MNRVSVGFFYKIIEKENKQNGNEKPKQFVN